MSATPEDSRLLHDRYAPPEGVYDELYQSPGSPRPHWAGVMESMDAVGRDGLLARAAEARRLLRENGVTYNVYSDPLGTERPWPLDPVPLLMDSSEWGGIETGLVQRAELLNLVLKDLYGPGTCSGRASCLRNWCSASAVSSMPATASRCRTMR
jgi:uncharacterized circularly permuted ATP-grasp superfamily protein